MEEVNRGGGGSVEEAVKERTITDNLNEAEENPRTESLPSNYCPPIKFVFAPRTFAGGGGGRREGLARRFGSMQEETNDSNRYFSPFPPPVVPFVFPVPFPRNQRFPRAYHCLLDFFRPLLPIVARLSLEEPTDETYPPTPRPSAFTGRVQCQRP